MLFKSDSHAVRAEKIFDENNIKSKSIPVPRDIGCDCGFCLLINKKDRLEIDDLIEYFHIRFEKFEKFK